MNDGYADKLAPVYEAFKQRYGHLHPLLFLRSVERADSLAALDDILVAVPENYPLRWDAAAARWVTIDKVA